MAGKLKIGVCGANGRVGRLLVDLIASHDACELSAVLVRSRLDIQVPENCSVSNDASQFLRSCDVVIDFSLPDSTDYLLDVLHDLPRPLVCGTTGLSKATMQKLSNLAKKTPVLYARNMSKGIAILDKLVAMVAKSMGDSDIEITEYHHHLKKDAPSGTALHLAESAAKARNLDLDKVRVSGRDGECGARKKDEIGVMALRGGDIVGRHNVGFYALGEFIELTHNATSRLTFAKGALEAALWLHTKPNALYGIKDLLDF